MNKYIEVKVISLKKGRGTFAKIDIKKGTLINIGNVVLISNKDYKKIQDTILDNYTFEWEDPKTKGEYATAIALDICQFMNHSYNPNLKNIYDYKNRTVEYVSVRNILKGEELVINYNGKVNDKTPVWFDVL